MWWELKYSKKILAGAKRWLALVEKKFQAAAHGEHIASHS